jgi:hypothetical protein
MALEPLSFYFSVKDPEFVSTPILVSDKPGNFISHVFVKAPIYDLTDKKIGYKVSDDYIQQVAADKYIVRLNNTYYIEGDQEGSISWQYVFENDIPEIYYPINQQAVTNIIATTGEYFGLGGTVSLFPKADGSRYVNIFFKPN